MNKIWYLIPSELMGDVTDHLDRAGVCFHVAGRDDLAQIIARRIIEADGKEFVPMTPGECIDRCIRWRLIDAGDGKGWNVPLTRKDAAILAVRLKALIEKGVNAL